MASEIEQEIQERKMEEWKYEFPFTAAILFGNRKVNPKEVSQLIKLGKDRRNGK